MQPGSILEKADKCLSIGVDLNDTRAVGLRHFDRAGKLYVVTHLTLAQVGALKPEEHELFGDEPIVLHPSKFRAWLQRYTATTSVGLQRYFCLKEVGIPFTRHKNVPLLLDSSSSLRSSIADMVLKFDIEQAGALLNVGRKAGFIDLREYGGRWLTKRWFVFDTLEDAALAKLKFATKDTQARLVEL